jgi:ribonuclease HII
MSEKTKKKTASLFAFDKALAEETSKVIVGVDEVGRGPLAGPVVSAAVCLDSNIVIDGINDSKKLSPAARDELYEIIRERAIAFAVASCTPQQIDKINILQASLLSMKMALEALTVPYDLVLIDGNQLIPGFDISKQKTIVKGDATSASIAAASIIAKVTRDRIMDEYHGQYPVYDFRQNKGYATEHHRNAITQHGLCEIHRRSFCTNILECQLSLFD